MLRFDIRAADGNCVQLVTADAPVEKLLTTCLRIKGPRRADLYDWHGERPTVFTNLQNRTTRVLRLIRDVLFDPGLCSKLLRYFTIPGRFARMNDVVAVWTKNFGKRRLVKLLRSE